jgi:hypothetical protein
VFMDFESADLINCRSRIFRKKSCLYWVHKQTFLVILPETIEYSNNYLHNTYMVLGTRGNFNYIRKCI